MSSASSVFSPVITGLARPLLATAVEADISVELLVGVEFAPPTRPSFDVRLLCTQPLLLCPGWRAPTSWQAAVLIASGRVDGDDRPFALAVATFEAPVVLTDATAEPLRPDPSPLVRWLEQTLAPPRIRRRHHSAP